MLDRPLVAVLNHLLVDEAWARRELAAFPGAVVRIVVPPLAAQDLVIAADGLVGIAPADVPPRLVVTLPAAAVARFPIDREAAARRAKIEGDVDLAQAVDRVATGLTWDAEEDLSRLVGDIPAHRIARAARSFAAWQKDAAGRLAENAREYLAEESGVLVAPADARAFGSEVITLRDALERLERRLDLLDARLSQSSGTQSSAAPRLDTTAPHGAGNP